MDRTELRPALMWRSVSFTRAEVGKLRRLRIQRMVNFRKRSQEFIHKRMMWWTGGGWNCINATYRRLGNRSLKAQCVARIQYAWGHDRSGPGSSSYLEHSSSTDCAFSFLSDSLPVLCLLFRHRISFQPFGWPQSKNPLLVVMTY